MQTSLNFNILLQMCIGQPAHQLEIKRNSQME